MSIGDGGDLNGSSADAFLDVVREGRSFSGRERHCAFLNLGDSSFCDVSTASGFDLQDDGRGLALVDWDRDGDLDVWISNRNGPQIRFLRNQASFGNHYVALRLHGTESNRDAVGATVRVFPESELKPIMRTVRAGDGFLSQGSKWLHFGLGESTAAVRVVVDWPSGISQSMTISELDRRYILTEGDDTAVVDAATLAFSKERLSRDPILASKDMAPDADSMASSLCFSMVHIPMQSYRDYDGRAKPILLPGGRMVLVNLWADWCQPCVRELADFARNEPQLRAQGLDVIAMSVDSVTPEPRSTVRSERDLLERIAFPFRAGRADKAAVEKLQLLHDTLFELRSPLPIPTSFLIDRQGRVVAIYKGAVSTDQLLEDKQRLTAKTTEEWRTATLRFSGRWMMPPRRRHLFDFVRALANRGYYEDCQRYVGWNERMLTSHPDWSEVAAQIRNGLKAAAVE